MTKAKPERRQKLKPQNAKGYDSALREKVDDDLGRWQFAAEIAEVIRSTPPEWSARIGIFGKWGEGKSTVLHFVDGMLQSEENIIFTFNPWAVQDLEDMWAEFGAQLIEALKEAEIFVDPRWKALARSAQSKLGATGLADVAEGAASLAGQDKIVKSAFGLVGHWLKPDGPQVRKIRESLGKKRVIVFIDDLDRANPELLPKLLLALRELLDLPGFTFVLAFDNEIVAKGLTSVNSAWEEGASFLDKILDFRFYLPRVSPDGKRRLLERMLREYCSFIPAASVAPIERLLPENPRKLKTLIRGMISLRTQVERHRPDELDWPTIWLAEMVRLESHSFFLRLLEGKTLDDLAGIGYRLNTGSSRRRGASEPSGNSDIQKLIEEVGGIPAVKVERLSELIKATRSVAGMNLLYNWRFAFRPEAITWKEFEGILARWIADQRPEVIIEWIAGQAAATSIEPERIEEELFQNLVNARDQAASEAASTSSAEEHARHIGKASELLRMTVQFLDVPGMLTAERFELLYGKSQYWIAFQMNEGDKALRQAEKAVLESTISKASSEVIPGIFKVLAPWDPWAFTPEEPTTMALKKQLRDDLVILVLPKMEQAVVEALKSSKISALVLKEEMPAFAYILLNPQSLPWNKPIRQAMLAIAQGAKSDLFRYDQVNDVLRLFFEIIENRTQNFSIDVVKTILQDREFISALWAGATSRGIQFRMLNLYLGYRSALIKVGASEDDLPLTPELKAAAARAQTQAAGSPAPESSANTDAIEEEGLSLDELAEEDDLT
jgi:hypothetical protein